MCQKYVPETVTNTTGEMPGEERSSLPRSNRNLQLGFSVITLLLPRNWSVANVNMWQLLRRGWDSTLGWSTRIHNQAQRFFGALKSLQGHWIALPLCCPTLGRNSAKIVKPPSQLDTSVRMVLLNKEKKRTLIPRLGWLDHQRQRVIDRPVPKLVVQLLET